MRLGGIDRLVELCKDADERNHSDAVLVACLAVLRRLRANYVSSDQQDDQLDRILEGLGATDLVQPKLVDSFMEFSTNKQESYV